MEISFYEEFPTKKNLEKLKLIKFKTKIFVAAKSISKFKEIEKQIKKIKKDVIVAYWPLIENSYWISAFSNSEDLIKLFKELDSIKNNLLIDLELPHQRKDMLLKNLNKLSKNKKIIKKFLKKNKERVTCPHVALFYFPKIMKMLGLSYETNYEKNPMFYTSTISKSTIKKSKKYLSKIKDKGNYNIGLGTIAIGIQGNEPILLPKKLEKDLDFIKKAGFKKATIFRLGGLNKEYIKVINKFTK